MVRESGDGSRNYEWLEKSKSKCKVLFECCKKLPTPAPRVVPGFLGNESMNKGLKKEKEKAIVLFWRMKVK